MGKVELSAGAMPAHGGDLAWASKTFAIPKAQWLDLSTGIAPWSWPVPEVPAEVWRTLPPSDHSLEIAAADYLACEPEQLLALPGSQFVIARLPHCLPCTSVAIPKTAYSEHRLAWQAAGHEIHLYESETQLIELVENSIVSSAVVVQPNNPTAYAFCPETLMALQKRLWERHGREGVLLVDEAFIDLRSAHSLCSRERQANCVVLRSLGKFFGLAGLRLGFLCAHSHWLNMFKRQVEPWLVSHPARWIGARALLDGHWIDAQRARIRDSDTHTSSCLQRYFGTHNIHSGGLFLSIFGPSEVFKEVFIALAQQGVLTRYFELGEQRAILRFGLAGDQLPRLNQSLANIENLINNS